MGGGLFLYYIDRPVGKRGKQRRGAADSLDHPGEGRREPLPVRPEGKLEGLREKIEKLRDKLRRLGEKT